MTRYLGKALLLSSALGITCAVNAQDLASDVKACRAQPEPQARLSCYDAIGLPPAASAAVAKFGQEALKPPTDAAPALKQVESVIRGRFQGWRPNKRIELENGQVWRIADDSEALYDLQDPKVIVHRGLFGAYFLEIEGVPFQVRVARAR